MLHRWRRLPCNVMSSPLPILLAACFSHKTPSIQVMHISKAFVAVALLVVLLGSVIPETGAVKP